MWSFFSKIIDKQGGISFLLGIVLGVLATLIFVQTDYYSRLFPKKVNIETSAPPVTNENAMSFVDLTGAWILVNTVEGANDSKYDNLILKFKMYLRQDKSNLKGTIVKFMEGNDSIPESRQTTIDLKGQIEGYSAIVSYKEKGKAGAFEWTYNEKSKKLEGYFTSEVAVSTGTSVAHRRKD